MGVLSWEFPVSVAVAGWSGCECRVYLRCVCVYEDGMCVRECGCISTGYVCESRCV